MQAHVYVAGPMSGITAYNTLSFQMAADTLRAQGHTVVTPFETSTRVWRRHYGVSFDPSTHVCDWGSPLMCEMMAENIKALSDASKVVFLPGWENSKGARLEYAFARTLGIPCELITGEALVQTVKVEIRNNSLFAA